MDPEVRTIARVGESPWMLVGLGFLMVGLLLLLAMQFGRDQIREPVAIVGGAFALLGIVLMCVRSGVILDRQQREITMWRGLLVPLYKARRPFSQAYFSRPNYVTLSREERKPSKGPIYEVFPVRLEGPGTDPITIHEQRDHDRARRLAEEIAKFLRLGMRDRSSGEEVAREANALDESLRERMKREGRSVPLPAQPPGGKAILSYGGIRSPTRIEIPAMSVHECARWSLMVMLVTGAMALLVEFGASLDGNQAFGVGIAGLTVFLSAFVFLAPLLIRAVILREQLLVSPDEIIVTRRDVFGTKTSRLAGAEIAMAPVTSIPTREKRAHSRTDMAGVSILVGDRIPP